MPAAHRLNDSNDAGAAVISIAQGTVYINNLLASIDGSEVAGHGVGEHSGPNTANGSSTVFIGGIPVNRQGDADTCGHGRAAGSPNVFYNDGSVGSASSAASTDSALAAGSSDIASSNFIPSWAGPGGISPLAVFDKVPAEVAAVAAMNMADGVITAIADAGLVNENSKLPFGGDIDNLENVNALGAPTALSETTKTAVNMWYTQQILDATKNAGLSNKWPSLPFGGNDANG